MSACIAEYEMRLVAFFATGDRIEKRVTLDRDRVPDGYVQQLCDYLAESAQKEHEKVLRASWCIPQQGGQA